MENLLISARTFGPSAWSCMRCSQDDSRSQVRPSRRCLDAVRETEPDWSKIPDQAQPLLRRCLEKDPGRRLRDIGDLEFLLEQAPAVAPRNGLAWALNVTLALGFVVLATMLWQVTRPAAKPLLRLDVDLGPDVALGSSLGPDVDHLADGTRLAYVSQGRLFTRRLDQLAARELPGTLGATNPFFSPDGEWMAFFASGKLKKIGVEQGAAVTLCDAVNGRGGSWGEDGNIIVALGNNGGLSRIPAAGGMPVPATQLDHERGELTHRWPQGLLRGNAVLFTSASATGYDDANIEALNFRNGRRKTVLRGGTFGRYLASGHLLYLHQGTLFAVAFDVNRLEVRGSPSPILNQVGYNPGSGFARIDVSRNGTVVYRSEQRPASVTVQWLYGTGDLQPLLDKPGQYLYPRLSPDGRRLAIAQAAGATQDLWVYDWQRGTMTRLTFGEGYPTNPVWSANGKYIAFEAPGAYSGHAQTGPASHSS